MNPMKYIVVTALTTAGGAIVTFLIYRARTRVDVDAKRDTTKIDIEAAEEKSRLLAANLPVQILREELSKKEEELSALRAEDKAERIANQQERAENLKTLVAMKGALEVIAADLKASREDSRQHAVNVHKRIDTLDDRLLVIETELSVKKKSA